MKHHYRIAAMAAFWACAAAGCGGGAGDAANTQRRVYVDPETGEIRPPTAREQAQTTEQSAARRRTGNDDPRILEGPGQSIIIVHGPDDWPEHGTTGAGDQVSGGRAQVDDGEAGTP